MLRGVLAVAAMALLAGCASPGEVSPGGSLPPVTVVITVVATLTPTTSPRAVAVSAARVADAAPVATLRPTRRPVSLSPAPTKTRPPTPPAIQSATPTEPPPAPPASLSPTLTAPTAPAAEAPPVMTATPLPPSPSPAATAPAAGSSLSPAPLAAAAPWISETTLTIATYDYEAALVPTAPEDAVYPYPRLDPARVGPPSPRTYRAVILQNGFVAVTILPELGGRIYRWVDKATGQNLLYENPVIKPTNWGYRGWWLAAGGIEWAFPVEEHGLNEYRPWQLSTGSTAYGLSVTVSDVDSRTGMEVGATISLDAGHAWITLQPYARNGTAEAKSYQLWLNAMLALNGNSMSGQTQFVLPTSEVIVHSSGDGGAPGSGAVMGWPIDNGRDMSLYGNWTGYLGFFAPNPTQGFTGVYDPAADQGIVRVFNPGWPAGTKIFGPANLPPGTWTDDGSGYVELWSGATTSFWSAATLLPGETFSWTEQWYPVHGLGGLTTANHVAALRLVEAGGVIEGRVAVPAAFEGRVVLFVGGQPVGDWPVRIVPGQVFRATWTRPADNGGAPALRLVGNDGTTVVETGL